VAEVRNTPWNETHCYVIDCLRSSGSSDELPECSKEMHVSPFLEMEMAYRWRIAAPSDRLTLGIENRTADGMPFRVDLALKRVPITASSRLRMLVRYPLLTWFIFLRIYLEAWRVWRLGVPFVSHPRHRSTPDRPNPTEPNSPEPNSIETIDTAKFIDTTEKLSA
jgi:DUF1365 family protein